MKDFAPITLGTTVPMVVIAHPLLLANYLLELLSLAKAKLRTLNFGSAGSGGTSHLAGEMIKIQGGVDMVHIPYRGGSQSLAGLTSGDTQYVFVTGSTALPQIKAGMVKVVGVAAPKRVAFLSDLPTHVLGWHDRIRSRLLVWRAGACRHPETVVEYLGREARAAMPDAKVNKQLIDRGFEVVASATAEFSALLEREVRKWTTVIKTAGVKPD